MGVVVANTRLPTLRHTIPLNFEFWFSKLQGNDNQLRPSPACPITHAVVGQKPWQGIRQKAILSNLAPCCEFELQVLRFKTNEAVWAFSSLYWSQIVTTLFSSFVLLPSVIRQ